MTGSAIRWNIPELDEALQKCRDTVGTVLPCDFPDYLQARREYHALLRKHGILEPPEGDR